MARSQRLCFALGLIAVLGLHATVAAVEEAAATPAAEEPPAGPPLPLPANPASTCGKEAFRAATTEAPACADTMYNYKPPNETCCTALYDYYGVNSTKPSRNCFCYEPYWTRLTELEETIYIQLMPYLDYCTALNMTIAYYQDGVGPCAGMAAVTATAEGSSESTEIPHSRSLRQWLRDLKGDGLMCFSFTLGLISAFGFFAILWPIVTDTGMEIAKRLAARRAR